MDVPDDRRAALLELACRAVAAAIRGRAIAAPPWRTSAPFGGCFVSVHEGADRRLRGCVGRIEPATTLEQAIIDSAGDAVADPRFASRPLGVASLHRLDVELTLLDPPAVAGDMSAFAPLDDAIVLDVCGRSGCFLPQVARRTGWDRRQLLERLCAEKMGLPADAWRDPSARLRVFAARILGPAPARDAPAPQA